MKTQKLEKKLKGKYRNAVQMVGLGMDIMAAARRLNELLAVAVVEGETVKVGNYDSTILGTGGEVHHVEYVCVNGRR